MTDYVARAYVNHGRWLADCPHPFCSNAELYGHWYDEARHAHFGLDESVFRCSECGTTAAAEWPSARTEIEQLLSYRPVPATRNWVPGEDIHDLFRENEQFGVSPGNPQRLADAGGPVLTILGDKITDGKMESVPGFRARRSLEAGQ